MLRLTRIFFTSWTIKSTYGSIWRRFVIRCAPIYICNVFNFLRFSLILGHRLSKWWKEKTYYNFSSLGEGGKRIKAVVHFKSCIVWFLTLLEHHFLSYWKTASDPSGLELYFWHVIIIKSCACPKQFQTWRVTLYNVRSGLPTLMWITKSILYPD